jgi:leucyl-tRNA synthetase
MIHTDVSVNSSDELDIEKFKAWREDYKDADLFVMKRKIHCGSRNRKMSKSKYNVVTQMIFVMNMEQIPCVCVLGPLEQANLGTQQVFREFWFLKKVVSFVF